MVASLWVLALLPHIIPASRIQNASLVFELQQRGLKRASLHEYARDKGNHKSDEELLELQHFGPRGIASVSVVYVKDDEEAPLLQEEPWYVGECIAAPTIGALRLVAVTKADDASSAIAQVAVFSNAQECIKGTFWPANNLVLDIPVDGNAHPLALAVQHESDATVAIMLTGGLREGKIAPQKSCHDFDGDNGGTCLGCISYKGGVKSGMFSKSDYECSWSVKTQKCHMRSPALKSKRVGEDWRTSFNECDDHKFTQYHGKQISFRAKAWANEIANRHRHSMLKMESGLHDIDSTRAQMWKDLQCSVLNKAIAQFILDNTHYYNFNDFYEAIKRQFIKFLLKIKKQTGTFKWVLLLHTADKFPDDPGKWKEKSNFWVGQLLAQIALEGAALPGGLLGEEAESGEDPYLPIDVAKSLGDSMFPASQKVNYLIVDDAMYTGRQLMTDIGWHTGPRHEEWTNGSKQVYWYKKHENHFSADFRDYSYLVNVLTPYTSAEGYKRVTGKLKFEYAAYYNYKFECRSDSGQAGPCFVDGFTFFYDSILPEFPNPKAKAYKKYFATHPSYKKLGEVWSIHAKFNGRPHQFLNGNKLVYFDHKIPDYVSSLPRVYALGVISPTADKDADEEHKHCRERPPKLFERGSNHIEWNDGCALSECNKLFSYPFVKGCFSPEQGVANPGDSDYWQDLVDERKGGTCQFAFYKEWER